MINQVFRWVSRRCRVVSGLNSFAFHSWTNQRAEYFSECPKSRKWMKNNALDHVETHPCTSNLNFVFARLLLLQLEAHSQLETQDKLRCRRNSRPLSWNAALIVPSLLYGVWFLEEGKVVCLCLRLIRLVTNTPMSGTRGRGESPSAGQHPSHLRH